MDAEPEQPALSDRQLEAVGLSTACFVFGVLSVLLSLIGVGAVLGVAGLLAGRRYRRSKFPITSAVRWGGTLSTVGLVAGVLFAAVHLQSRLKGGDDEPLRVWEGVPAPEFTMRLADGHQVRLSDYRGKRVALELWATWCGPCRKQIPHLDRLHQETSRDDLVIIGVSAEDPEVVSRFGRQHGISYPLATPAGPLPRPILDVTGIPMTFVIDRNGIIQSVAGGYHSYEELRNLLRGEDFDGEIKPVPPDGHVPESATRQ